MYEEHSRLYGEAGASRQTIQKSSPDILKVPRQRDPAGHCEAIIDVKGKTGFASSGPLCMMVGQAGHDGHVVGEQRVSIHMLFRFVKIIDDRIPVPA
jgi:hypothetical protein